MIGMSLHLETTIGHYTTCVSPSMSPSPPRLVAIPSPPRPCNLEDSTASQDSAKTRAGARAPGGDPPPTCPAPPAL